MHTVGHLFIVLPLVVSLVACENDPSGPPVARDVVIVVHSTGGIAAMDWTVTLDGAAREARCEGSCPWNADVRVMTRSEVERIAQAFVDAGVRQHPHTDYGVCGQCADQFFHEVEYHDGTGTYRADGDGPSIPDELETAINLLAFEPAQD